jgi:hypothetical protein
MLTLVYGSEKSSGQKRSSASAAASSSPGPSSPAPSSGGSVSQNGLSDIPSRTTSSPGVSKRKSSTLTQETVQTAISAAAIDRVDSARSSSPTPSKTSAKSFRFSLPQNAGDLMGAPTPEKAERSPRSRPGYESDSRAQRRRSNSQLTAMDPSSVVSPSASPKSKKRSNSVSSNPAAIVSESKQKRYVCCMVKFISHLLNYNIYSFIATAESFRFFLVVRLPRCASGYLTFLWVSLSLSISFTPRKHDFGSHCGTRKFSEHGPFFPWLWLVRARNCFSASHSLSFVSRRKWLTN